MNPNACGSRWGRIQTAETDGDWTEILSCAGICLDVVDPFFPGFRLGLITSI